jgi:hypothetical protein
LLQFANAVSARFPRMESDPISPPC